MNTLIQAFKKFSGGVHVPHEKRTAENETVIMPMPATVTIPMQQHIGAPCQPTVKAREMVTIGQVIGDSEAFISAPIHAPISGKVKKIKPILLSNGRTCEAIQIENDGLDTYHPDLAPVAVHSKDDLVAAARASGLVGIGGAGFPLHAKLANKENLSIDTLVVNGAECEPYITSDYRESIEFPARIITGMEIVMKHLGITRGIIGMEDNKLKGLKSLADQLNIRAVGAVKIEVMSLPTRYPQGAEKMLIYAATGRKVPTGKLPAHAGCLVLNISTVSLFAEYLATGIPLIKKRVTVAGDVIAHPQNVLVPIGTQLSDILDFCGLNEAPKKVILGGPMMGIAQYTTETPITKQNNAVLAFSEQGSELPAEQPCIRCGRCITACPLLLQPVQIERFAKIQDLEMLHKLNVATCMECGSCSYVCPSGRKLVQYMKQAKQLEREAVK